ncbi:3-carboxy-cis,cis-muconate cycloisomerase [Streptomyces sp. NBC_01304]|uniref:3-carboxy-cis,cis-muconate cycloisomerase n=1 Tax=Streptomyces sp. NBC_01304 TaxID=2903818 RepID=UPI002E145F7C|nr:3-carboxy-cis,cis-muconate cycloisomerase [Streptomyces sp. NBC_01304]
MNSPFPASRFPAEPSAPDAGLLAPVWAGSPGAAVTSDVAFLQAMLDAEAALARAQGALGLIPARAAEVITAAARAEAYDVTSLAVRARAGGNPVIPLVADLTEAVAAVDAEAAEYVHRGATSQDIMDSAVMLVAARTLDPLLADLCGLTSLLAQLALAHRDTVMAGRTLTQHAVPTTFGLKAAGWRALVLDAHDRLAQVRAGLPAQLGGAAGTLAALHGRDSDAALDLMDCYARELGLSAPELPWHVLRTPVAELGSSLALCTGALGKVAADVLVLSRTEIGEVGEGGGGGSSAMPHKSNPVRATLIASAARQVPSLAAVLYGSMVAEDERPAGAWHAEWGPLREALRLTAGAARQAVELVAALVVRPERMGANLALSGGLVVSERVAAELAPRLGRSRARQLLADAGRRAVAEGVGLGEVLGCHPEVSGVLAPERLSGLLDPSGYVGAAAALTERALRRKPMGVAAVPGGGKDESPPRPFP